MKVTALIATASLGIAVATAMTGELSKMAARNSAAIASPSHSAMRSAVATESKTPCKLMLSEASSSDGEYTLLFEDFSNDFWATGSIGDPDINCPNTERQDWDLEVHKYWWNLREDLFITPGWGGRSIYPAGGSICLLSEWIDRDLIESHLALPTLDGSDPKYEGIVRIQFSARVKDGAPSDNYLLLEASETYGKGPTWDILGSMPVRLNDQWQTFDWYVMGGKSSVFFNFYAGFGEGVYLDDIKVYQVEQKVHTPLPTCFTDYKGDSFVAHWTASEGAEYYLVNVYDVYGEPVYTNLKSTTNSLKIEDLDSGEVYYYDVRGVAGDFESLCSWRFEVNSAEIPEFEAPDDLADDCSYTSRWNDVPAGSAAQSQGLSMFYDHMAYYERVAEEDGEFVITDEDFTGIMMLGENPQPSGWTKENPSDQTYSTAFLQELKQAGWEGRNYAPYTDYVCLDAWQYIYGRSDAGLISPELDLSKNGGVFTMSADLSAAEFIGFDENGSEVRGYTRGMFVLFNFNEEKQDYDQVESFYFDSVNFDFKTFSGTFTKGSKKSRIGIYAVYAPENLYVDNIKVTQQYKKGEALDDPYHMAPYIMGTEVKVPAKDFIKGHALYRKIRSVKPVDVNYWTGDLIFVKTNFSDLKHVAGSPEPSSVAAMPSLSKALVTVEGDRVLCISNPQGKEVSVFSLDGRCIYNNADGALNHKVKVEKGIYIVKAGKDTVKITL